MRHPSNRSEPLQREYLITIWRTCQEPIVQTLLQELARLQGVVRGAEVLRQSIDKELKSQGGGQLAAAHQLRVLLSAEPALLKPPARPRTAAREPDPLFPDDPWPTEPPCYGR
ncbi:MAG: hypothetical protein JWR10_2807 [Rubritepida sp.]|nr:hypothetical protein [Rubritepida sp.]